MAIQAKPMAAAILIADARGIFKPIRWTGGYDPNDTGERNGDLDPRRYMAIDWASPTRKRPSRGYARHVRRMKQGRR